MTLTLAHVWMSNNLWYHRDKHPIHHLFWCSPEYQGLEPDPSLAIATGYITYLCNLVSLQFLSSRRCAIHLSRHSSPCWSSRNPKLRHAEKNMFPTDVCSWGLYCPFREKTDVSGALWVESPLWLIRSSCWFCCWFHPRFGGCHRSSSWIELSPLVDSYTLW